MAAEVKQKDPIFKPSGLLTLGLQHLREDKKSVYWSLPLACLQHYGYPVPTSRSTGSKTARVTYQQFAHILIECPFVGWKSFAQTNEEGLKWLQRLGNIAQLSGARVSLNPLVPTWLNFFVDAARELECCEASERKAAFQLISLGRRRSTFLYPNSQLISPLFSLSDTPVLLLFSKLSTEFAYYGSVALVSI